ncbi:phosphotransferase enzyme family protein [Actinoplanes regularis]|uniref:Phosphotransferase enzyme family protein n=1 Tax=Actinoplanes regularis TaxID=52697 RepID=A0A239AJM7_9ACTN|nr:phosphotransferase [Actinoplanes regularis]GIE91859.1 hypothetical protein Are01nite_83390 [Actinoplanes regularis]SNR95113.1 Phosphotransferase enzyme family protein [Actinoplanes regularis]
MIPDSALDGNDPEGTTPNAPREGTLPNALQEGTTPDAMSEGTTPDTPPEDTTPDALQEGTMSDPLPEGATPDAVPDDTMPKALREGAAPDAMPEGATPNAVPDDTMPKALRKGAAPDAMPEGAMPAALPDPAVCAGWRLTPGALLSARSTHTWAATRGDSEYVLQRVSRATSPDWRYPLRVAAALRERGWPTPELAEEPWETADGVWLLAHRLPGRPRSAAGPDSPTEQRERGRLLAGLHATLAETGITEQRDGYRSPAEVVGDPELDRTLRSYEMIHPEDGAQLRACREETAAWFEANPADDAPRGVIHGDFAPWNLLFDGER